VASDGFLVLEELPVGFDAVILVEVMVRVAGGQGVDGLGFAPADAAFDELLVFMGVVVAFDFRCQVATP